MKAALISVEQNIKFHSVIIGIQKMSPAQLQHSLSALPNYQYSTIGIFLSIALNPAGVQPPTQQLQLREEGPMIVDSIAIKIQL